MFKNILIAKLVIFVFTFGLAADEVQYKRGGTTVLEVFPKEIKIGDTLYCVIKATNDADVARYRRTVLNGAAYRGGHLSWVGFDEVKNSIFDGEKKWEIYPYIEKLTARVDFGSLPEVLVNPRSSALLFAYDIRVVSLEDLHTPFWQDVQKNLQQHGKEMELRVKFQPYFDDLSVLSEKIKIQPRKGNEMKLLEEWHRNTPLYLFPTLNLDEGYNRNSNKDDSEKWIRKKVKVGYSYDAPQVFLRLRNLYPCYPNLPEDWKGWKELEEKFEPSTLRDEIRWTRICYQYCATEDDKVLDDLKSWLEKMNPIQRAVMVNYRKEGEFKKSPATIKLYETIQLFKDKK